MTPIGHLSISYISSKSIRNLSLPAIIIGGILPDIDFLFISFEWFNKYHHVITHNLVFIIFTALAGFFVVPREKSKTVLLSMLLGASLHLFVDSCMDNNPTNGVGVALFWPFYKQTLSPFNLLSPSGIEAGWGDPIGMIKPMLLVVLYEVPFYILSIYLLLRNRRV